MSHILISAEADDKYLRMNEECRLLNAWNERLVRFHLVQTEALIRDYLTAIIITDSCVRNKDH